MEYRFHEKIPRQSIERICPVSVSRLKHLLFFLLLLRIYA